ncbi:MAG: hypothetical protein HETSPECPRED_002517 [Heterodermia speciosa]|uniref:Uncharacterized protein n=1 Tax=Heterodermia speciosa TaxID=116794 RepID=A0A8H3I5C6_9LECA|nr:MAG: hypothetical protein HETSPECPRED_002517 [Heterodermia speciosa]
MKPSTLIHLASTILFSSAAPLVTNQATTTNTTNSLTTDSGLSPQYVCTFQAFSGNQCDGAAGGVITLQGGVSQCVGTTNRHSYRLSAGCPAGTTYLYEASKCSTGSAYSTQYHNPGQQCYNVNIGTAWNSAQFAQVC